MFMKNMLRVSLIGLTTAVFLSGAYAQAPAASTPDTLDHREAARSAETAASSSRKMSGKETERKALFWFRLLDTDKSGSLSRSEIRGISALNKEFDHADADGNGEVTEAEIRALSKKRVAERRARKAREKAEAEAAAGKAQATATP